MLFSLYPNLTRKAKSIREFFHFTYCKKTDNHDGKQMTICCGGRLLASEENSSSEQVEEEQMMIDREEQGSDSGRDAELSSSEDDVGRRSYESDDFEFMDNNYFRGG